MTKEFKDWLDEFVKQGADAKDVTNWPEEAGGGTTIVDELPETGEANTIYELHEQVEPAYNWVAMITSQMNNDGVVYGHGDAQYLIFDTYEQMSIIINGLQTSDLRIKSVICYLRNEDKLYKIEWLKTKEWRFTEFNKASAYTFEVPYEEVGYATVYILKSYEGYDEADDDYYGTLYNGTKVTLGDGLFGFILHQATFDMMISFNSCVNSMVHQVSTLPTAKEAVDNYLDELIASYGGIVVEIDGVVKSNILDNGNYHWGMKEAHHKPIYNFFQYVEEADEPIYTGELEWDDIPSEIVFTEIPYQDIFDGNLPQWTFQPEQGGDKVSYWIYANNTWTNTEDIGKPVEQEVIYGELLEGPTFSTDHKFISPYTNEQICNYIEEGKPVILRYHEKYMSDNEFMYVYINGYVPTEMDVEYVNQPLHYDNFTCRKYTTTDRIMYNYGSDYFYYEIGE